MGFPVNLLISAGLIGTGGCFREMIGTGGYRSVPIDRYRYKHWSKGNQKASSLQICQSSRCRPSSSKVMDFQIWFANVLECSEHFLGDLERRAMYTGSPEAFQNVCKPNLKINLYEWWWQYAGFCWVFLDLERWCPLIPFDEPFWSDDATSNRPATIPESTAVGCYRTKSSKNEKYSSIPFQNT